MSSSASGSGSGGPAQGHPSAQGPSGHQGLPQQHVHDPSFLGGAHLNAMMAAQPMYGNPHLASLPTQQQQQQQQQQQLLLQQQQQHLPQHQLAAADAVAFLSQQQRPTAGSALQPTPQSLPTAPGFHHPQMSPAGPYGPTTPGHVNLGPAGYFAAPAGVPQIAQPSAVQPHLQQQHRAHAQSQHAMMMPPPPGAMPPGLKGPHIEVPSIMSGADNIGGAPPANNAFSGPSPGEAESSSIVLPPLPSKGASDFVKKLFNMLDDELYQPIVSWSAAGDSFVVKNLNDFTNHVLPRHFRHSNFASFVRQLNKYDFHKVKNANSNDDMDPMANITASGDQLWEFKHPDFIRGREDLLENVKRKAPVTKKGKGVADDRDGSPPLAENPSDLAVKAAEGYTELKSQVATLTAVQEQMNRHINGLTKQYQGIIGEMLTFQRNMVQQDQLMQNLIQYLMNMENDRSKDGAQPGKLEGSSGARQLLNAAEGPFIGPQEARSLIGSYAEVARASFSQMSEITKRIQGVQQSLEPAPAPDAPSGRSEAKSPVNEGTSPSADVHTSGATGSEEAGIGFRRHGFSTGSASSGSPQSRMYLHPPHFNDDGAGELFNPSAAFGAGPLASMDAAGLRVFTVGTLQPREDFAPENDKRGYTEEGGKDKLPVPALEELPEDMPRLDRRASGSLSPGSLTKPLSPQDNAGPSRSLSSSPKDDSVPGPAALPRSPGRTDSLGSGSPILRVRRSTYVPGWAVPPRVLLVDDDAVCRKLSSRFLQVFGCAIDVAVDGVNAVNKMNLEKYDLVLMDIVMPNLDGVSATSLIRQFDPRTPIISMTSNSQPNELLTYMQNGMTDVLPKPFTKEGLLGMLEKHLIHLKSVSQMEQIPRQLGLPPITEGALQEMLTSAAGSVPGLNGAAQASSDNTSRPQTRLSIMGSSTTGEDGKDSTSMNPLASLGFSDQDYIAMLQNFIASGSVTDSGEGEITSHLAEAVGASLPEGQGGARRPSLAVLAQHRKRSPSSLAAAPASEPADEPADDVLSMPRKRQRTVGGG